MLVKVYRKISNEQKETARERRNKNPNIILLQLIMKFASTTTILDINTTISEINLSSLQEFFNIKRNSHKIESHHKLCLQRPSPSNRTGVVLKRNKKQKQQQHLNRNFSTIKNWKNQNFCNCTS